MILSVFPSVVAVQTKDSEGKMFDLDVLKEFNEFKINFEKQNKDMPNPSFIGILYTIFLTIFGFFLLIWVIIKMLIPEEEI